MRRVIALAAWCGAVAALACASTGAPPGGPEDKIPPAVARTTPDSGDTLVRAKEVVFEFNSVVNDRPSGGATELNQLFLISPNDGEPRVSWHRTHVDVRPRRGFRANTAYRVTLLPGMVDMRGNIMKDTKTIVFSTGTTFPRFGILGRVFDWAAERPAGGAFVEAISLPDSTDYIAAADSTGQFDLGPLPAGRYLVRAIVDQNRNRRIDRQEKWDTVTVAVTDTRPTVELRAIERDTLPAIISSVTVADSLTLRVEFDKPLWPSQTFTPASFRLARADSTVVPILAVLTEAAAAEQQKAREDSLAKARQDSIARADTTHKADTTRSAVPAPPVLNVPHPAAPPTPKPALPAPPRRLILQIAPTSPLEPGARYRLTATGLRNLLFYTRPVSRTFTVPKKTAADSTARTASPDSTRRPPRAPR